MNVFEKLLVKLGLKEKKDWPKPSITADFILLRQTEDPMNPDILLVKRKKNPYGGCWALVGGFFDPLKDESIAAAAERELQEETNVSIYDYNFFWYYDEMERDPRGRTVTFVFVGELDKEQLKTQQIRAQDDAAAVEWFPINNLPPMAFDHEDIISDWLRRVHYPKFSHEANGY